MRILFYDDSIVYITKEQGEKVKQAVTSGVEWIEIDETMYAVKSIKQIQADKPATEALALPVGTKELPKAQRERNIERIRQMKRDFLARRAARRAGK